MIGTNIKFLNSKFGIFMYKEQQIILKDSKSSELRQQMLESGLDHRPTF